MLSVAVAIVLHRTSSSAGTTVHIHINQRLDMMITQQKASSRHMAWNTSQHTYPYLTGFFRQ